MNKTLISFAILFVILVTTANAETYFCVSQGKYVFNKKGESPLVLETGGDQKSACAKLEDVMGKTDSGDVVGLMVTLGKDGFFFEVYEITERPKDNGRYIVMIKR